MSEEPAYAIRNQHEDEMDDDGGFEIVERPSAADQPPPPPPPAHRESVFTKFLDAVEAFLFDDTDSEYVASTPELQSPKQQESQSPSRQLGNDEKKDADDTIAAAAAAPPLMSKRSSVILNHIPLPDSDILITKESVCMIRQLLPPLVQTREWRLIYSLKKNGASLTTLYRNCKNFGGECIVLVEPRGADNARVPSVIGAYSPATLHINPMYYGSVDTLVFKMQNLEAEPEAYRWSGKNQFFVLSNTQGVGFGGGSSFALRFDDKLYHCSSGASETFDNPPLLPDDQSSFFECLNVEIWGLGLEE
eukprot:TRINITY_DN2704_c0_g1_i1.p1 TRINITY_DN2704_c0_g1~~TRINITY_DN2704_c0_g1_i1.p1  ORF type:complete len:305 (-),score=74.13 TRINITY_DN2704_c0_g1_i1:48-962(-)